MSIQAEAADGSVHEFPEGTPREVIDKRMKAYAIQAKFDADRKQEQFAKGVASRKEALEAPLTHYAKQFLQGAGKAAVTPVTWGLDALVPQAGDYPELADKGVPRTPDFTAQLQQSGSPPGNLTAKYLAAGGEGVGGSWMVPGMAIERPIFTALSGLGGGLGSEAGAQTGGEGSSEALRRFLGSLVGSALPGIPYAFMGHKEDLARKALLDVSPEELTRGRRNMYYAQAEGVPITLSQGMDRPSNIDRIADVLQSDASGLKSQKILRDQPAAVSSKMEVNVKKLPGAATSQQQAANVAQEASSEALKQATDFRRSEFLREFDNGGQIRLPTKVMETLDLRLSEMAKGYPNQVGADLIQDLRTALRNGRVPTRNLMRLFEQETGQTGVANLHDGKWINQVGELAGVLRSQKANLKGPNLKGAPIGKEEAAKFTDAIKLVQGVMEDASPKYKAANLRYQELSKNLVSPLRKGPVGRLAARGANETEEAAASRVFSIFDKGTSVSSSSEILTLQREWEKAGQGKAFLDVAKSWFAQKISHAVKDFGDRPNEMNPEALYTALAGNKAQKQGLRDILVGMARTQGLENEHEFADGFMNFMKAVGAAARRPHLPPGEQPFALQQGAGSNPVSWFLKLFSIVPFSEAAGATKRFYSHKAFAALDDIVSDPDKVPMLLELAREPIMSKKSQVLVNAILTSTMTHLGDMEVPMAERAEMRATPPETGTR